MGVCCPCACTLGKEAEDTFPPGILDGVPVSPVLGCPFTSDGNTPAQQSTMVWVDGQYGTISLVPLLSLQRPGQGCARSPLGTISPLSPLCGSPKADDGVSARTHWCSPAQSCTVVGADSCGTDWDPQQLDRAWSCSPGDAQ